MKTFFNKTQNKKTLQDKYNYIKNHFYYYTGNSWNGLKSLANNVKIYNLPLTEQQKNKFYELNADEQTSEQLYDYINDYINEYNQDSNYYNIYFNGRSGGYLVLYKKNSNDNAIDDDILYSENYNDIIDYYKNNLQWTVRESRAEAKQLVIKNFEIVKKFDEFCDNVLAGLVYFLDNSTIEETEITYTKKIKTINL